MASYSLKRKKRQLSGKETERATKQMRHRSGDHGRQHEMIAFVQKRVEEGRRGTVGNYNKEK